MTQITDGLDAVVTDAIEQTLASRSFESMVQARVDQMMRDLVDDVCRWGTVRDAMRTRLEGLLVPAIEGYDLGRCNVKLESLFDQLIEESAIAERRQLLENAKLLMGHAPAPKEASLADLFDIYADFVAEHFDCSGRTVDCGTYDNIATRVRTEPVETRLHGSMFEHMNLVFEPIEQDDPNDSNQDLARSLRLTRYCRDDHWTIDDLRDVRMSDLRSLDEFMVKMCAMSQARTHVTLETDEITDEVEPNHAPEVEFV